MSASDPLAEGRRWLSYADDDLQAAEALLAHPEVAPRLSCFLAQQAVEKAIKAALIASGIEFPRHHNLDALRSLLPADWKIRTAHTDLAELTAWSVAARYPGEWPEATIDDAQSAITLANAVVTSIAMDFEAREDTHERGA
ncbi:HEPN domain-containing protein [soil metagenome]